MNRGLDLNHCSKLRHFLHGESQGQGTTEFILVLLLTVGIVLGAALQLNQSFASFARNYFGDYLQCLLRRGELPALGIQDPTASTCNANYQPFTLAEGRPFVGYNVTFGSGSGSGGSGGAGSGGSGGSGSGTNNGGGNGTGDGQGEGSTASRSAEGPGTSGGRGTIAGSARGRNGTGFGDDFNGGSSAGGGEEAEKKKKKSYTGSTGDAIPAGAKNSSQTNASSREQGILLNGYVTQTFKKEEELSEPIPVTATTKQKETEQRKKKRMLIVRKPAQATVEAEDVEWGFGDYMRYLIILAIIVALFVFLGGQAQQVFKSMD